MSEEKILPPSDNVSSTSTRLGDTETVQRSPSVSLNSLLEATEACIEDCIEVNINTDVGYKKRNFFCNDIAQCVWGVLLVLLSVGSFTFTPLDFMLREKLNMRPGMPPFEWWSDPPDEVKLRVYVFNVTNHERYLGGLDDKLNVREIGPIVYLEKLLHSDIKFNDNSTMTYTAKRFPIYLPQDNTIDLNATIIVPNIAVLGIFSYLYEAPYIIRALLTSMASVYGSQPFVRRTIQEYLWNFTDPLLDTSRSLVPGLVPVNNVGILDRIYSDFTDQVTVKVGPQWGHKQFFHIDKFEGEPQLPGFDPVTCPDRIFGSTEGVMYSQRLTKDDVLLYWRKTVCKLMPLYFDSELTMARVPLYRYNLSENVYDRLVNTTDCYDTEPTLMAGLSDASKCYYNFPMVVSYPHFYTGGIPKDHFVTGLTPDRYKHNSYAVLEPYTGTPFEAVARMQSNLRMHDLRAYNNVFSKFSNQVIPLFWGEYKQEGLPSKIQLAVYFTVVILPPLSVLISTTMLIIGLYLLTKHLYSNGLHNSKIKSFLLFKSQRANSNKVFAFEKETFLKT